MRPAVMSLVMTTPMLLPMSSSSSPESYRCSSIAVCNAAETVDAVKRCRLVGFGKRGVVEYRVDEVIEFAAKRHDRLSNVQQLAGPFSDDVHAEQVACLAMEDDL